MGDSTYRNQNIYGLKGLRLSISILTGVLPALLWAEQVKYSFHSTRSPENGYAKPGDKVVFTAQLLANGKPVELPFKAFLHAEGTSPVIQKATGMVTMEAVAPNAGFVYFTANYHWPDGEKAGRQATRSWMNAIASEPEKILPGMPKPKDFTAFWNEAKSELAEIPLKADLKPMPVEDAKFAQTVDCYEIRIDCVGGRRAFGYLTLPKKRTLKALPALIRFDGAGVYVHKPEYRFASDGFLTLSLNAHGIETGRDATENALLKKIKSGRYYTSLGWDDPKTTAFYGMLMRGLRGVEYLKRRPEWNGKVLVSYGASQGGAQALAIAGLAAEDITFCYAGVPGLCNNGGIERNQTRGWPGNFPWNKKTRRAAGYLDNCNFARLVRCPVLLSAAWKDNLTRPSSVYAAYSQIVTPKRIQAYPNLSHYDAIKALVDEARLKVLEHANKTTGAK